VSGLGLDILQHRLQSISSKKVWGVVLKVIGELIEASAPRVACGSLAQIHDSICEVIGFRGDIALLMALDKIPKIRKGDAVGYLSKQIYVPVGEALLGRAIDPLGRALDGMPEPLCNENRPLYANAPNPLKRQLIEATLPTGVRAIDGLLSLGEGQRISIMAGSGVGKSTLMGMLARHAKADINVIALVGERGREVREFIERDLAEGLSKSVVVVSTSDVSPALQIKGVQAATSIAEFFRDQGKRVLMMTDSLTRLAMAQRQLGLAAGEPPTSKGYPPSVFTLLPRLLERGGMGENGGSITSVSTVLIEGDDINDPIGDTVRSIVDGHIVLSRRLVSYGHYPPVDVLESLSRTMSETASPEQLLWAREIRKMIAVYQENEELIRLGAYKKGSDTLVDLSIEFKPQIDAFLQQDRREKTSFEEVKKLMELLYEGITSKQKKVRRS
jgi:flagellum-specific ATP synthase